MAVTLADIRADVGELYNAMENGTTAVNSLITKAEGMVTAVAGTTTNLDIAVRNLADFYVCQHIIGGVDPVSKTIGANLTLGPKEIKNMRDGFLDDYERFMKIKGYSIDGLRINIELSNG